MSRGIIWIGTWIVQKSIYFSSLKWVDCSIWSDRAQLLFSQSTESTKVSVWILPEFIFYYIYLKNFTPQVYIFYKANVTYGLVVQYVKKIFILSWKTYIL